MSLDRNLCIDLRVFEYRSIDYEAQKQIVGPRVMSSCSVLLWSIFSVENPALGCS